MIKMKVRRNHVMKNIYPFESIAFWWSEIIVAAGDKKANWNTKMALWKIWKIGPHC